MSLGEILDELLGLDRGGDNVMTWEELVDLFPKFEGIDETYLILNSQGDYLVPLSSFEAMFRADFDGDKPYESLVASKSTSPAWRAVWDNLHEEGKLP